MKGYEMDVVVSFTETCGFLNVISKSNFKVVIKKVWLLLLHPQQFTATIFAIVEALNSNRKVSSVLISCHGSSSPGLLRGLWAINIKFIYL